MQERDDTQATCNHGNACSLSKCRPHQCWIASITASLSAFFLPSPKPFRPPHSRTSPVCPGKKRSSSCQHSFISVYLISLIDNPNWVQEPILHLLVSSADSLPCVTCFLNKVRLRGRVVSAQCDSSASTLGLPKCAQPYTVCHCV